MVKQVVLALALTVSGGVAFSQDQATPVAADANTTATEAATTASSAVSQAFSQERFESRWKTERELYEKAGISKDKIEKLREINQELWNARASGKKLDFQELSRKRSEVLSKEDMQKLRDVRRAAIRDRLQADDTATTASE